MVGKMHIKTKKLSDYPWYLRKIYNKQIKTHGQILLPGLFWGRFPRLQVLFLMFWSYLDRDTSTLAPSLRALCQVRVAQLNACKFCIDYNALNLLKRTDTLDKVDYLDQRETHDSFTEIERIALTYVEVMTGMHVNVSTELMDQLKAFFNDDQIVELTALISFQNMSAKFNAALDIPSQGLCKISKE